MKHQICTQDPGAGPMVHDGPVRIVNRWQTTPRVTVMDLGRPDGLPLPGADPGAHALLRFGAFQRRYSLLPSPAPGLWRIAVLREETGRGGSRALCDAPGPITAAGPENYFPLGTDHRHVTLIAGGIGITPIFAMATALDRAGTPFALHYAVRSQTEAALLEELLASSFAASVVLHDASRGGRVDLEAIVAKAPAESHLYVCGPERLNSAAQRAAEAQGWPPERVHAERFSSAAPPAGAEEDGVFWIELASTGERFEVPPGRTMVEVLAAEGVFISTSCAEGICGMCVTSLLSGAADHRDGVLTDAEKSGNTAITPCCSRGKPGETLVIDL